MKRATNTRRRFGYKDFLGWTGVMIMHYAAYFAYAAIFALIKFLTKTDLFPEHKYIFMMIMIIVPGISGLLHISYDELGSPWLRLMMWIVALIMGIMIPIIIFVL